MNKTLCLLVSILALAGSALASPTGVEPGSTESKAVITKNLEAISKVCGCPLGIDVNWEAFPGSESKRQVANSIDSFVGAANSYCAKGPEKKKNFCNHFDTITIVSDKDGAAINLEDTRIVVRPGKQPVIAQTDFTEFFEKVG